MYEVQLSKKSMKALDTFEPKLRNRVIKALKKLQQNPTIGKSLKGKLDGLYSYRVWPYRIIYEVYEKNSVVLVINIVHRQGAYK